MQVQKKSPLNTESYPCSGGIFYSAKLYYKHKDLYNEHVWIKYTMLLYRQ